MATAQSGEWRAWREDVARAALDHALPLLQEWLPAGKVEGRSYKCGSLGGDKGRSLTVWLDKGNWKDFGSDEKGGNLVALYACVRGIGYRAANEELAERFRVEKPKLQTRQRWIPVSPVPDFAPYDDSGFPRLDFRLPGDVNGLWSYLDTEGQLLYHRVRIETPSGKQFRPITFCTNQDTGEAGWQLVDMKSPRPLYGLELFGMFGNDAPVLFVEGEKTAEAARILLPDWLVVTAGSSSISGKNTDFSPLLARKGRVVIWPDNDQPGLRMAAELALIFNGRAEIVQPDSSWRQGWDLADGAAEGWDTARTLDYLETHVIKVAPEPQERVECDISGSDLEVRSQATFAAVGQAQAGNLGLFKADSGELAIVQSGIRTAADIPRLRHWLTSRIRFSGRDREGNLRPVTPPDQLLENLMVYHDSPLPRLTRLIRRPAFSADGRLVIEPGHDKASGLFYMPARGLEGLEIRNDVDAAVELIDDMLCDFHFEHPSDRAHLFAMLLQPAFREMIEGPTPLYRFEAPQPGSGKTLLFEACAALLFEPGWPFITTPSTEDEWGKALLGHLRNGPEGLLIDNAHTLSSYHLAAALTAWPYWSGRLLYQQGTFHVPISNIWAATMNNPQFSGEMYRRSVRVRITGADAERPEARGGFRHDPLLSWVASERRELVEALLTLAIAAQKTMKPWNARRLGSFESWAQVMGGVLEALNIGHFLEPTEDYGETSDRADWSAFIAAWASDEALSWKACKAKDLLATAQDAGVYLGHGKDASQLKYLSNALQAHRGSVEQGYKLVIKEDKHTKNHTFRLVGSNTRMPAEEANAEESPF